jgi:hypothetical protein
LAPPPPGRPKALYGTPVLYRFPVLFVHRSERADLLVAMLAELLQVPAPDPMSQELVAVPTRGIERWLTQQLSHTLGTGPDRRDGICANVEFPFPGTLVSSALAAGSGIEEESDPWVADRSVWPLLEVIGSSLEEPWLRPLASHLRNAAPEGERRSYASARHIADLFDRYAVHRPEMVLEWSRGSDAGVPADGSWQAALWRRLRERIGTPSPAERLSGACERLGSGQRVAGSVSQASRSATSRFWSRWAPRTMSTSSYCTLRRSCGSGSHRHRDHLRAKGARTPPQQKSAILYSGRGVVTAARCSSCS